MPTPDHDPDFVDEFPALAASLRGQFHVEREIGRGGMGVVFLAREERLDRLVALKVLPSSLAAEPGTRERFLREARTAARLAHPNVVPVYRADEAGDTAFFAMAFVDGESLADRLRDRGPLPAADAVPILRDAAWALAYAHARGVVHRDVKPENIFLERATGRTLLGDFGIAHHTAITEDSRLTQDGYVLGTVHYMSPEQVNDQPLDGRSDLYALGVVAYQVLTGRLPFEGLAMHAVLVAHATRPAPPLASVASQVPAALAAVVDRCLAKLPDDRWATGEALAEALEGALASAPVRVTAPAFPPGLPERIDETQAAAIWRRAAQLQADALHRLEARDQFARTARLARGDASTAGQGGASTPLDGYRLADVAGAAEEAGISRQYVAMALAELPTGTLPTTAAAALGVSERDATRFLGTDTRSVGVTVEVPAPPGRTLRALGAVLQQAPYELILRAAVGPHPLDGGVLVFDLPGPIVGAGGAMASSVNFFWMATHQQLEARQVQVTLRAIHGDVPGAPERTQLTMTADLRPGVRGNVRTAQWTAGAAASFTGVFTGVALAKGAAVAASVAVLAPAIAVAAVTAVVSVGIYRAYYPTVLQKAEAEMRQALHAIAGGIRAEAMFGALPGPGRSARGTSGGDDGDAGASSLVVIA